MTTENTATKPTEAPFVPKFSPLTVKRNEVELVFVPNQIKKGEHKGSEYLAPEVTEENLDTVLAYIGRKLGASKIGAFLRSMSQGWFDDAEDEATDKTSGQLNMDKFSEVFLKLASEFSARGENIASLNAQINDLVMQLTELDITKMDPMTYGQKASELAGEIKDLQLAISLKRRDKKEATATA